MKSFRHILPLLLVLGGLLLPGSCLANLASQEASLGTLSGLPSTSLDEPHAGMEAGEFYRAFLLVQVEAQAKADASKTTEFWIALDLPASAAGIFNSWREIRVRGTDLRVYEFAGTDPPSSVGTAPILPGATERKRVRETTSKLETRVRAFGVLESGFALDEVGPGGRPALDLSGSSAVTRIRFVSFIDGPNRYRWNRNNPLRFIDLNGLVAGPIDNIGGSGGNHNNLPYARDTASGQYFVEVGVAARNGGIYGGVRGAAGGPQGVVGGVLLGAASAVGHKIVRDLFVEAAIANRTANGGAGCNSGDTRAQVNAELSQMERELGPVMMRGSLIGFGSEGPRKVYHGTDSASAESIRTKGLDRNAWKGAAGGAGVDPKGFSVTTDRSVAEKWAAARAWERGGPAVVLEADVGGLPLSNRPPSGSFLDADELFISPSNFGNVGPGTFR